MTNEATIQFEYIVQRWLGSLSSVGLSDSAVTNLATAIGHLGSGNIAGLRKHGWNETYLQWQVLVQVV